MGILARCTIVQGVNKRAWEAGSRFSVTFVQGLRNVALRLRVLLTPCAGVRVLLFRLTCEFV